MNIQQFPAFCKPANAIINPTLTNSNLIPHIWYHKILRGGNKPDNVGITILSELLQLHLASETGEREFQLGYAHFKTKFNYTCEQAYMSLVRLDESGLISRRTKSNNNINNLYLTLNVENLLALHDESDNKSDRDEDNNSISANPNTSAITDKSPNIDLYIDITKKDIEVKKEEYISGSTFNQNSAQEQNPTSEPQGIIQSAKKWVKNLTRQPIASFHPLTEEDAETLRLSSDREFNLHFINQLVLRLADKYPNHGFYTKKLFLKYMTEILANEMRQAVKVNNESFRFKKTDDEGVAEEYLARVEDGRSSSASDQIRRKVAAAYEPAIAYKILTSCYFPEKAYEGKYEIRQRLPLELSNRQHEQLHSQISAVFGDSVRSIEIKNSHLVAKKTQSSTSRKLQATAVEYHVSDATTLWGRVRSSLIATYGEAIDKSWFSRLEDKEDAGSRKLILTGTSFLTDYIQTHYSHVIERLCREENYQLKIS